MSAIKYLLDEDVAKYLGTAIERADAAITVIRVGQPGAPLFRTLDPELLTWAERNGYAIVSNDRNTMTAHAAVHLQAGHRSWGVFIVRTGFTVKEVVDSLILIHAAAQAEEWQDQVEYIPFH